MYYIVYKIENKISGRFYIGCHKTVDLDDGYMGSGLYLKRAIEKYGIENFEKEILHVFDNPEEMFLMEQMLIDPHDLENYNIMEGGYGGWDHVNTLISKEQRSKYGRMGAYKKYENIKRAYKNNPTECTYCGTALSYKKRSNKFCNSSCSAKFNNSNRQLTKIKKYVNDIKYTITKCVNCGDWFKADGMKKLCSNKCKQYYRAPYIKKIDDNIDEMIEVYYDMKSINKTLKHFNITNGEDRKGSAYFSKKLKALNVPIFFGKGESNG